jgi:nitrogen fixation protein FixH
MSKRNVVWLVAIVVVGAIAWVAVTWWIGLVAAGATLAVSELFERAARKRRRASRS